MTSVKESDADRLFSLVGEFGVYQFVIVVLASITNLIPAIVAYGYAFYGTIPKYRCKLPQIENDTFEIFSDYQRDLINRYIPDNVEGAIKQIYDPCHLKVYSNNSFVNSSDSFTLAKCNDWVYSKQYFESTIVTEWSLVCDRTSRRSFLQTLYFTSQYLVFLTGVFSDRFGRKKATYVLVIGNAIIHVAMSALLMSKYFSPQVEEVIFILLRSMTGFTSNSYTVAMILAIEMCGTSKRVKAGSIIYYLYILGELLTVGMAYFIRRHDYLILSYTVIFVFITFYFWIVPESPRWLLSKKRIPEALKIFHRIAKSNRRPFDDMDEMTDLKPVINEEKESLLSNRRLSQHSLMMHRKSISLTTAPLKKMEKVSLWPALKNMAGSFKVMILLLSVFVNWFSNNLVYYGISFNTGDLAGDPYLNFTVSIIAELLAIICCDFTLDRFGRKLPYSITTICAGVALLMIQFVPITYPTIVTVLTMIGKFMISYTHNVMYIVTAEVCPTVIRNSLVSFIQTFGGLGTIISPYVQLLGEVYWFPLPFIIYGAFSAAAATTFLLFIPETKGRRMPDTIDDMIEGYTWPGVIGRLQRCFSSSS